MSNNVRSVQVQFLEIGDDLVGFENMLHLLASSDAKSLQHPRVHN